MTFSGVGAFHGQTSSVSTGRADETGGAAIRPVPPPVQPTPMDRGVFFSELATLVEVSLPTEKISETIDPCLVVPEYYRPDGDVPGKFTARLLQDMRLLGRLNSGKSLLKELIESANANKVKLGFYPEFDTVTEPITTDGTVSIIRIGIDYSASVPGQFADKLVEVDPLGPNDDYHKGAALNLDDGTIVPYRCPTFTTLGHELEHALEQIEALAFLRRHANDPSLVPNSHEFDAAVLKYYDDAGRPGHYASTGSAVNKLMRLYASQKLFALSGIDTMPPSLPRPPPVPATSTGTPSAHGVPDAAPGMPNSDVAQLWKSLFGEQQEMESLAILGAVGHPHFSESALLHEASRHPDRNGLLGG